MPGHPSEKADGFHDRDSSVRPAIMISPPFPMTDIAGNYIPKSAPNDARADIFYLDL
jgi:hypothetical protein